MAQKLFDVTGQRFGKLVATGIRLPPEPGRKNEWKWECVCDCGQVTKATGSHLRSGDVTSCGCEASRKTVGARRREKMLAKTPAQYLAENSVPHESGCILWTGAIGGTGYGVGQIAGRLIASHRLAYEVRHGEIPKGMHVCHACDVRACINPDHLFVGTHQDNMQDKVSKARQSRGEVHGMAKIYEEQALFILKSGMSNSELAKMFGITRDHVAIIKSGKAWKHLHEGDRA